MSNFTVEFQNAQTDWQWKEGKHLADVDSDGIEFDDAFVVPDVTPKYPFFTWTNFRILCNHDFEKINLWARSHQEPNQLDLDGRMHQSGDAVSTYADYKTLSNVFKDSDRFYFWIKGTDKGSSYSISQTIYDDLMSTKAVNLDGDITPDSDITDIANWLGWNPKTNPAGSGIHARSVNSNSNAADVARWIIGWDNSCTGVQSDVINPAIGLEYQAAFLDTYDMIDGTAGQWLGCPAGKYIYGKLLYTLEYHTSPGKIVEGDYANYRLLNTIGFKSCEIAISGIRYRF